MLDAEMMKHPVIRDCVDELVEGRGGLVVYGQGLGGRETLVAAAVGVAAATGKPLTIVDADPLRQATAHLTAQLGLTGHTFLSPDQAANWPTGFDPEAVLAVHGDVLRNPDLIEPLRAAARDASLHGHLLVARHPYGSPLLDTYTSQARHITTASFTPAPATPDSTGPHPPGPVTRRVQSPSWQARHLKEPAWTPRETDRRPQPPAHDQATAQELFIPIPDPADPTGPSERARQRGRSSQAAWRQQRQTQPDAPDPGPLPPQPDADATFRGTREQSTGSADPWADPEAARQFLAPLLPGAEHTGTAPDPSVGTATGQPHTAPQDAPARAVRDRLAPLLEQSRARQDHAEQALATPLPDRNRTASSGPPGTHGLGQRQATDHPHHDGGPRPR